MNYEFPDRPDRTMVYLTGTQKVHVDQYAEMYLKARGIPLQDVYVSAVREWIAKMPGEGTLYKSDLDYFLRANLHKHVPGLKGGRER
jgi:hypothetical protein